MQMCLLMGIFIYVRRVSIFLNVNFTFTPSDGALLAERYSCKHTETSSA